MTNLTGRSTPEQGLQEKPEEPAANAEYKRRFEEAVVDAQYLLVYASSKCPNDIRRDTLEKLINIRRSVESHRAVSAQEESDFWLAYQEIWKLVQPATAESIKANLPLEVTGRLFQNIPFLAQWLGKRVVSKARRTVNKYIVFTVFILILLLTFQIYWVIGNQLITQSADLLKAEADVSLKLDQNQKEYKTIEILYQQKEAENFKTSGTYTFYSSPEWVRDTLENISTKTRLDTEVESLKTQLDRSSAFLLIWSRPWKGLIEEDQAGSSAHNDKYALDFDRINGQMEAINKNLKDDPDGKTTAAALNSTLSPQLKSVNDQLSGLYASDNDIDLEEAKIQEQIKGINNQLTDLAGDISSRENQTSALQGQLNTLNAQLTNLDAAKAFNDEQSKGIANQLSALINDPNADASRRSALEAQLDALKSQLTGLEKDRADTKAKIDEITNQLGALSGDENARTDRKSALETQLNDLKLRLTDLQAKKTVTGDQIQRLQAQRNDLNAWLVSPDQLVNQWKQELERLAGEKKTLERQEQSDANRERARQAQLAGQFVLAILQGYVLPLLYGILGASTSILRALSEQIKKVTYSEEAGIQHLLRISLGALAGIMVGWFTFLIPSEAANVTGTISPMAIAFIVGYNIEIFFSLMDVAINRIKGVSPQPDPPAAPEREQPAAPQADVAAPPQEPPSEETPAPKG